MKILFIVLIFISHTVLPQVRLRDLVVKDTIIGTEKIPVSGHGTPGPAITPNLIKAWLKIDSLSIRIKFLESQLAQNNYALICGRIEYLSNRIDYFEYIHQSNQPAQASTVNVIAVGTKSKRTMRKSLRSTRKIAASKQAKHSIK